MAEKTNTLSIQDLSDLIDVPAKTIRKILRANSDKEIQPGRGRRWVIRESDIEGIKSMINSHTSKAATVFVLPTE